jgi:hypothetical protein
VLWRLLFIGSTLLYGKGLPLYAILWMVMDRTLRPERPQPTPRDLDDDEREIWDAVKKDMKFLEIESRGYTVTKNS